MTGVSLTRGQEAPRLLGAVDVVGVALNEEPLRFGHETHASRAQKRQGPPGSARFWVSRLRTEHRLFTVQWGGQTLVPAVQLDEDCGLRQDVPALIQPLSQAELKGWSLWA